MADLCAGLPRLVHSPKGTLTIHTSYVHSPKGACCRDGHDGYGCPLLFVHSQVTYSHQIVSSELFYTLRVNLG